MKRLATVVAALALTLGTTTASPAHATTPACSTDGTFCVSYDAHVYAPGTTTPETRTQQPVDLTVDLANDSPGHDTDTSTWAHQITVRPLAVSVTSGPLVTRSADLPDGLLVAGSATDCGTSTSCTAGYGTGYASGGSCPSGVICAFQFGIQRISNVQATTHHNEFTVVLSGCITSFSLCGFTTFNDLAQNVSFDAAPGSGVQQLTFTFDTSGLPVANASIDTLHLAINGSSDQTTAGAADRSYDWFRLPPTCGTASGAATATDNAGKSASATATFTVTGCLAVTGTASTHQVRYGGHATLSGGLSATDPDSPSPSDAPLLLRACPAGRACTTSSTTAGGTGAWSVVVTPRRTTTYSVLYAGPAADADWVPVGRSFTVRVLPLVSRRASSTRVPHGGRIALTGAVTPNDAGAKAALQRYTAGSWRTLATTRVSARSTYALRARLVGRAGNRARLRVRVAGNARFATATSRSVTITLT